MKPKAFDYIRAATTEEALQCLARGGEDARVLAGGQSLVPMLNLRLLEPEILVDISQIASLAYTRVNGGMLEIGAATTQAALQDHPELGRWAPLLRAALPYVGHYETRGQGTVCGSLAHADPSSELPLCLATLGGEVVLRSQRGERVLSAQAFQLGMLHTDRRPDELIVAARFPVKSQGTGYAFEEMAQRRGDFAVVAVACAVSDGKIRLGVGGVADKPTVREWDGLANDEVDDALNELAWELGGFDDVHASASYRRQLVRRLGSRVIEEASACRD
jgi:2-furoyl-CoA dehydrogenase FAD binding subunit